MELIGAIFGPIFLLLFIAVGFGMMAGVKADRVVNTFFNVFAQMLLAVGDILVKITIPLLKQLGEKIVYTTKHYLAEQEKQKPQIAKGQSQDAGDSSASTIKTPPEQEPAPKPEKQNKQSKPSSANPYDDPPEPEIMD